MGFYLALILFFVIADGLIAWDLYRRQKSTTRKGMMRAWKVIR